MGAPIIPDPDYPPGRDCSLCTPDPWPPGQTPGRIRLVFHGVQACAGFPAFPNDKPFWLYQDQYDACYWWANIEFGGDTWFLRWSAVNGAAIARIVTQGNILAFTGGSTSCTDDPITNNSSCVWHAAENGHAYALKLPHPAVTELAINMNFLPDPTGLFDQFVAADPDQLCIRLTGRRSSGSCLILFEP
ncbi:MAG: hypothetical protein MUO63_12210 [Desulfobulbaceae bacterium]|nr:hypothetical protein [Desulfobulbaceae bacterium]